uniref:Uncharacterized protein n=1 Tax=Arundo donax TaxID=35708 RepID=A0A0A8YUY1_ARUDO
MSFLISIALLAAVRGLLSQRVAALGRYRSTCSQSRLRPSARRQCFPRCDASLEPPGERGASQLHCDGGGRRPRGEERTWVVGCADLPTVVPIRDSAVGTKHPFQSRVTAATAVPGHRAHPGIHVLRGDGGGRRGWRRRGDGGGQRRHAPRQGAAASAAWGRWGGIPVAAKGEAMVRRCSRSSVVGGRANWREMVRVEQLEVGDGS